LNLADKPVDNYKKTSSSIRVIPCNYNIEKSM